MQREALCGVLGILLMAGAVLAADVPVAGGLMSLPIEKRAVVSIADAGFEGQAKDGLEEPAAGGWRMTTGGGEAATFAIVQAEPHAGTRCLKADLNQKTKWVPSASLAVPTAKEAGIYELKFWVKTQSINSANKRGGVRVALNWGTEEGKGRATTKVFTGTSAWQEVATKALIPPEFKPGSLQIHIHRYGKPAGGVAFFDDFSLARIRPSPVEAYLRYPNYRGFLADDASQTVRIWVRVNDRAASEAPRVEVVDAAGKTIATASLAAGKTEGELTFEAGQWPLGTYDLKAKLGASEYPPYRIHKISADIRKQLGVWFDENQILYVKGKPTFPIGFYNTIMNFGVVDESEIARLEKMVESPVNFNINYTWWGCDLATRKRYLDEMHRRGILYLDTMMPFSPPKPNGLKADAFPVIKELAPDAGVLDTQEKMDAFLTKLARNMRTFPGHAGYYVMDERPFNRIPDIFHQYTILKAADPDHPTYGVSNKPGEYYLWRDTFDVFGMDPYPLMNMKRGLPLSLAGQWTRVTREATQHSRPVWTVHHFFQGWSSDRWPTEEELRSMSLMSITEGARGVFFWSYGTRALAWVKDKKKQAEYWQRAVKVTQEIKSLEPALLAPDAPSLVKSVSDKRIRWRAREADGRWTVFAYLPAEKFAEREATPAVDFVFTLKDGRTKTLKLRPDTADWFAVPAKAD